VPHNGSRLSLLKILALIIKDLLCKKDRKKGNFIPVLCLAYASILEIPGYQVLFQRLVDLDAVVVISAGNYVLRNETMDTYPALYAVEYKNVIIVEVVDIDGQRLPFSQGGRL
jgi:hypothetical protein